MQGCTLIVALVALGLVLYVLCRLRILRPVQTPMPSLPMMAMQKWDTIQNVMSWRSEMSSLDGIIHDLTPEPAKQRSACKVPEWWPPPAEEEEPPTATTRRRGNAGP